MTVKEWMRRGGVGVLVWGVALVVGSSNPSSRASAQLRPVEREGAPEVSVYVDDGVRVEARRVGPGSNGLSRLVLERGAHTFEAAVGDEVIVRLAPDRDPRRLVHAYGLDYVRPLMARAGLHLARARAEEDGLSAASRLSSELGDSLLQVVPDLHLAHRTADFEVPPDDARYSGQWYLERMEIEEAWRLGVGDPETTIVIVDNGCDLTHPDLEASFLGGRDVREDTDDPSFLPSTPGNEHGTACAGLAAAIGHNGIGIAGACPRCTLRCVRLLGAPGEPTAVSADVAAFDFALEVDAAIVSNSWGFTEAIPVPGPLRVAIERVVDEGRGGRGALVVFAAGNDNRMIGDDELTGVRGVITVGALNNFSEAAQFSNFGASVDLTAPTGTLTTDIAGPDGADPGDYTSRFGGTSSSAPLVAGVLGLMVSAAPETSGEALAEVLISSTRPAPFARPDEDGHDPLYGYGQLDPGAAMRTLLGVPPDAGPPSLDAGIGADGGEGIEEGEGCGCRAPGSGAGRPPLFALALFALFGLSLGRGRSRRRGA